MGCAYGNVMSMCMSTLLDPAEGHMKFRVYICHYYPTFIKGKVVPVII